MDMVQDEEELKKDADFSKNDALISEIQGKIDKIEDIVANYAKKNYDNIPLEEDHYEPTHVKPSKNPKVLS